MCIITAAAAAAGASIAAAVSAAAGTAVSAAISLSQSAAQKQAAAYQIEQQKKEAQKAEMEAAYERQEGVETARKQKLDSILKTGRERVKTAAGNIALSSSLAINLEEESSLNSELDALNTQNKAESRAQKLIDKRNSLYADAELTSYNSSINSRMSYAKLGLGFINNAPVSFGKAS